MRRRKLFSPEAATCRASEREVSATYLFPAAVHPAFGAVPSSPRLHWTEVAARDEAEEWAFKLGLGPPYSQRVDDTAARAGERAFVVRSIPLPLSAP